MASKILLLHETCKELQAFKGKLILTEAEGKTWHRLMDNLAHCRREIKDAWIFNNIYSRYDLEVIS